MTQPTKLAIISSRLKIKLFQEALGDDWKVVAYRGFFDVDRNSSPATIVLDSYTDAQKERMTEIQQSIDKGNYQKVVFVKELDSFSKAYTKRLRDNLTFTCEVQELVWDDTGYTKGLIRYYMTENLDSQNIIKLPINSDLIWKYLDCLKSKQHTIDVIFFNVNGIKGDVSFVRPVLVKGVVQHIPQALKPTLENEEILAKIVFAVYDSKGNLIVEQFKHVVITDKEFITNQGEGICELFDLPVGKLNTVFEALQEKIKSIIHKG